MWTPGIKVAIVCIGTSVSHFTATAGCWEMFFLCEIVVKCYVISFVKIIVLALGTFFSGHILPFFA